MIEPREIRERRKKLKITQKELAERVGVSQSLIAKLEAGTIDPKLSLVKKILRVFEELERKKKAEDVMNSPVIVADIDDSISKVAKVMIEKGISQMPVVDRGMIVGSVSERGIFKAFYEGKRDLRVRDIIEAPLPEIGPKAEISEISRLLLDNPAIVVVEKGKILGIITKHDLMKLNAGR
ncbi:MAG: CBS domain-containing protein [Archaeoglobales archaeon]|jgi:predicted transcriptional regulator|nr:CBS domain-containing protein [Archaeoglobus sp.]NHW89005.1 CBS domain-containing protein [Archaeoglobales archaeon]